MSDTPRTDAAEYDMYYGHYVVDADFARELERENNRLRKALESKVTIKTDGALSEEKSFVRSY